MDEQKARKVVRIVAGIFFAIVLVFLIFSLATYNWNDREFPPSFFMLYVLAPLAICIADLIGIWFYKNWARILFIIIFVIGLITSTSLIFYLRPTKYLGIILLIISIFLIYLFGFNKSIKQVFEKQKLVKIAKPKKK
jgi:hypothetical protein